MLLCVKLLQRSVYSSQRCEFEPISSPLLCSEGLVYNRRIGGKRPAFVLVLPQLSWHCRMW
ncbi:hypothetical protein T05_7838 [Trichinella murrelli]|uniref:Uncharacterized protein n=1 Tax=Trichinella murrelli TaxID=144512 RepID=A0A0V0SS51_9BILA|nr:hypothetical protein T05_7838 [Trichinella murrelli]